MAKRSQARLSDFFTPASRTTSKKRAQQPESPGTDETATPTPPPRVAPQSRRVAAERAAPEPRKEDVEIEQLPGKRACRGAVVAHVESPPLCERVPNALMSLLQARLLGGTGNARAFVRDVMAHSLFDFYPVAACESVGRIEAYCMNVSATHGMVAFGGKGGSLACMPSGPFFGATRSRPLDEDGALSFEEIAIDPPKFAGLGVHTRWTSDVCFPARDRVVTSSDDGTVACGTLRLLQSLTATKLQVCIWSVEDEFRLPLRVAASVEVVPDVGVYSCDTNGDAICVSLKNSSLHMMDAHTLQQTHAVHNAHDGKVAKCVRLQGSRVASCGNDRSLRLGDLRSNDVQVVADLHKRPVNSVAWNPCDNTKIMTSSFDGLVHVTDTRHAVRPIVTATAYDAGRDSQSAILKPAWTGFGTRIATLSPHRSAMHCFALATGERLFSVDAPFALKIAQLASDSVEQDFVLCVTNSGCVIAMQNHALDHDDESDD